MEQTIEQTIEQYRVIGLRGLMLGAVDNYFNFLQGTISSYPSGGTDLRRKSEELRSAEHRCDARIRTKN